MAVIRWGNTITVSTANTSLGGFGGFGAGPAVTALATGGFALAWTEGTGNARTANFQIFGAAGEFIGSKISIGSDNGATYTPDIASIGTTITLTWVRDLNNGGNEDVRLSQFTTAGAPINTVQNVAATTALENNVAIAAGFGGYALTYTSDSDIFVRLHDGNGVFSAGNSVAVGPNTQITSTTAVLPNGNVVVAWFDLTTNDYRMNLYSSSLSTTVVTNVQVASATIDGGDYKPSITGLANGNFVVAWHDQSSRPSDTSSYHIGYQLFDAGGAKLGTERVANITSTSLQARGDVTALADGGFIITWSDGRNGGSGAYDVYGARFDVDGNRVGGEFSVATGPGSQADPAMALLADGRVVVTWIDGSDGTVKYQIVDPRDGVVSGTAANDILLGHPILGAQITGEDGNDQLFGGAGVDLLYGGAGNDTLDGGAGGDGMYGGRGDDTYSMDNATDQVFELSGEGTDTVVTGVQGITLQDNVEIGRLIGSATVMTGNAQDNQIVAVSNLASTLSGGDGADVLFGSVLADSLDGGIGDDIFRGSGGADTFVGGAGNDQFVVQNVNTVIVENPGGGIDTAFVAVNDYVLSANIEIGRLSAPGAFRLFGSATSEDLVANSGEASVIDAGGGNDVLWGSGFADTLNGNLGDDVLRGQGGADSMIGGADNDQYVAFDAGCIITEALNDGYDIVYFAGLANTTLNIGANVEEARLVSTATALIGNALGNLLVGNNAGAASAIDGGGGADTIFGTTAADTLTGGAGDDALYSQGGADRFRYSGPAWGYDQIAGFVQGSAKLDFTGSGITFPQLTIVSGGGNSQVEFGGSAILVFGVATLVAGDFLF